MAKAETLITHCLHLCVKRTEASFRLYVPLTLRCIKMFRVSERAQAQVSVASLSSQVGEESKQGSGSGLIAGAVSHIQTPTSKHFKTGARHSSVCRCGGGFLWFYPRLRKCKEQEDMTGKPLVFLR